MAEIERTHTVPSIAAFIPTAGSGATAAPTTSRGCLDNSLVFQGSPVGERVPHSGDVLVLGTAKEKCAFINHSLSF